MPSRYLEVTYRNGRALVAYLYLERRVGRKAACTKEVGPSLLVDFAAGGEPIGIEIVDPELVTAQDVNVVLRQLGLPEMTADQLRPLRAA